MPGRAIGLLGTGLLVLGLCAAACDIDLFGTDEQPMVGPYSLTVWEGGTYSLTKDKRDYCGVLNGHVLRIGWNDRVILAERESCRDEKSRGWMVVDLKTHKIEGPLDTATVKSRPELDGIKIRAADVVWKSLRSGGH